jgi:hypothetical protein
VKRELKKLKGRCPTGDRPGMLLWCFEQTDWTTVPLNGLTLQRREGTKTRSQAQNRASWCSSPSFSLCFLLSPNKASSISSPKGRARHIRSRFFLAYGRTQNVGYLVTSQPGVFPSLSCWLKLLHNHNPAKIWFDRHARSSPCPLVPLSGSWMVRAYFSRYLPRLTWLVRVLSRVLHHIAPIISTLTILVGTLSQRYLGLYKGHRAS